MYFPEKNQAWTAGAIIAGGAFLNLFIGVRLVLEHELLAKNIIAFIVFSLISGFAAFMLVRFQYRRAFPIYLLGLIIGFIEMYRHFSRDMSGWGDLAGVMSLLTWSIIGLGAGIIVQLIGHLIRKKE